MKSHFWKVLAVLGILVGDLAALDFPPAPALNQQYVDGANTWVWNGNAWVVVSGTTGGGGAGTKTIAFFTARDGLPPGTNFATPDTRNGSIAVLDFADGVTNKGIILIGGIPEGAVLTSGISVTITWMATSATTGNGRWGAQMEATGTDLDADSFDTAVEVTTATSATSGIEVTTTITLSAADIDDIVAGQRYRLFVYRDSSDALDTVNGTDLEFVSAELRTAN